VSEAALEDLWWVLTVDALDRSWRALMEAGIAFEAAGELRLAASAYDLAYGAAPDEPMVVESRRRVLDRLEVREHGLVFRYVPAGAFVMGNDEGEPDERPAHAVVLDGYWITDVPITWAAYCRLMGWEPPPDGVPPEAELPVEAEPGARSAVFGLYEDNKIRLQYCESHTTEAGDWHAHLELTPESGLRDLFPEPPRDDAEAPESFDDKPMVAVGWYDAEALSELLSTPDVHYWLPSEAEWEKAARGGLRGCPYPWGTDPPSASRCDFGGFDRASIMVPRSYAPNGYGLHAMVGTVWEWTHDWYDAEAYAHSTVLNPEGPPDGVEKVLRGGSWADCEDVCTVTWRMALRPSGWRDDPHGDARNPNVGFRLVRHDTRAHGVERP
jgi:sulfatase modifying factor 1